MVHVYRDSREVCDLRTKSGMAEYRRRVRTMWLRQRRRCCLEGWIRECPGKLALAEACFEHQDGRGMDAGHRDDRIEIGGRRYNGAAHPWCNSEKGSRRMDYTGFYEEQAIGARQ